MLYKMFGQLAVVGLPWGLGVNYKGFCIIVLMTWQACSGVGSSMRWMDGWNGRLGSPRDY